MTYIQRRESSLRKKIYDLCETIKKSIKEQPDIFNSLELDSIKENLSRAVSVVDRVTAARRAAAARTAPARDRAPEA